MKITLRLNLDHLEPRGMDESRESRARRKRFKQAMRDLEVDQPKHLIPILEALLAANAHQLQGDLQVTSGDYWLRPDLPVRLIDEHSVRAVALGEALIPLLEQAAVA